MKPEDVPAELVEKMARARIAAQHGRPLTDAEWSAVRSRIEETWIASALAAVLPELQAQVLDVEGVALVLKAHRRDGRKSWAPRVVCVCGWVGESVDHETHIAAALHVARLTARDYCDGGCINPGSGDCPTCKAACGGQA